MVHTPGPWQVNYVVDGAFEIQARSDSDPVVIASRAALARRHFEFIDNANLIAAAPELYAVLMRVLEEIPRTELDYSSLAEAITSALAKARGDAT